MDSDPVATNPDQYRVIMENERVRVLEYRDKPGDKTSPHRHPDSIMFRLSAFNRRLSSGGREVEVELPDGVSRWLGAQEHSGENAGDTETHTIFIELKGTVAAGAAHRTAAPAGGQPLDPQAD
jgi:hypothetical protein